MTCNEMNRYGPAYAAGELDSDLAEAVEAHARSCGRCRSRLEHYRQAWERLSAWQPPEPSEEMISAVRLEAANALARDRLEGFMPFPARVAATAAAMLLAALSAWYARGLFEARKAPGSTEGPKAAVIASVPSSPAAERVTYVYIVPAGGGMPYPVAVRRITQEDLLAPKTQPEEVYPVGYTY